MAGPPRQGQRLAHPVQDPERWAGGGCNLTPASYVPDQHCGVCPAQMGVQGALQRKSCALEVEAQN